MSDERITRRSAGEPTRGRTDWERLQKLSEEEIERAAAEDPDNPLWTEEELAAAELVMPAEEPKVPVSIRLDREVVDYFKAEGPGYQSRINAALLGYVRSRKRRRLWRTRRQRREES